MSLRRAGLTLPEVVIAFGLSALIAGAAWQIFSQGQWISRKIGAESEAGQDTRLKLKRISFEIQEGTRLFHPPPGKTATGVGFVNAKGETVFYYAETPDGGRPGLYRANVNLPDQPPELVIAHLKHFRATTAPVGRGRVPSLVHLDLAVGAAIAGVESNSVTSVFMRGLEKPVPEDPTHEPVGVPDP